LKKENVISHHAKKYSLGFQMSLNQADGAAFSTGHGGVVIGNDGKAQTSHITTSYADGVEDAG
jgi:hypothetical protein